MKKLTIALATGLMSMSGWSACSYNFDATQQDLQSANTNIFPVISNGKVSYTTVLSDKVYMALSKNIANLISGENDPGSALLLVNGDKTITSNGIQAFEFKFQLPQIIANGTMLNAFPILAGGKMENGNNFFIMISYQKLGSTNSFYVTTRDMGENGLGPTLQFQPQNTLDGYQNIGIYLNQNTRQIGVTFDGINQGYSYSYPSKLQNMYFTIASNYSGMTNIDVNKEFSVELLTEAAKITQSYPTGTKDICGNTI